jgi:predicted nucleotidyltransferase
VPAEDPIEGPVGRRVAIATRVAEAYRSDPHVGAVLLAGSVARGLADEMSDIELDVYWTRPPTPLERRAAVEGAGWERVYDHVDEHEFADGLSAEGVKVDVSGFTTTTIEHYLDAALSGDTEPELQVRVTALRDGQALHGADLVERWRRRVEVYPEQLAAAMVQEGLALRSKERLEMLAARDDVVLLHRDVVDGVQGVLDALFGLNRVWCPHPHHKWLEWEATLLPRQPPALVERVRRLVAAPADEVADRLGGLVDDTLDLAEVHVPAADVASLRSDFHARRVIPT